MNYTIMDLFPTDENAYDVMHDMKAVVQVFCDDNNLEKPSDMSMDTFTTQVVLCSIGAIALDGALKHIDDLLENRPYAPAVSEFHNKIEELWNSLNDENEL